MCRMGPGSLRAQGPLKSLCGSGCPLPARLLHLEVGVLEPADPGAPAIGLSVLTPLVPASLAQGLRACMSQRLPPCSPWSSA